MSNDSRIAGINRGITGAPRDGVGPTRIETREAVGALGMQVAGSLPATVRELVSTLGVYRDLEGLDEADRASLSSVRRLPTADLKALETKLDRALDQIDTARGRIPAAADENAVSKLERLHDGVARVRGLVSAELTLRSSPETFASCKRERANARIEEARRRFRSQQDTRPAPAKPGAGLNPPAGRTLPEAGRDGVDPAKLGTREAVERFGERIIGSLSVELRTPLKHLIDLHGSAWSESRNQRMDEWSGGCRSAIQKMTAKDLESSRLKLEQALHQMNHKALDRIDAEDTRAALGELEASVDTVLEYVWAEQASRSEGGLANECKKKIEE